MSFRFEIGLLPRMAVAEVAEQVVAAEDLGFDGAWIADSQSIFRDAWAALALAAGRTSKIRLATGVTNPVTRHPAVLASDIATLDELSGGRATLGIGVGESAVRTLGLRPARLSELEEATLVIRALAAGEKVQYRDNEIHLTWSQRKVPIFFASSGPKSLRLAGRIADGVLFQVGAEPALVRYALRHVQAGASEAGRSLKDVRLFMRLACAVSPDRDSVRRQVRGYAAVAAGTVFSSVPKQEMPLDLWTEIKAMKDRYDYYEHASSTARHEALLTERIVDAMAVAGTPDEVVPRLRALMGLGMEGFIMPITTPDPRKTMRVLAEEVISRLA